MKSMKEEKDIISFLLFIFGLALAVFHIVPTFLPNTLKKPLTWGDALDFLTIFAVVPLAFLLYFYTRQVLKSQGSIGFSPRILRILAKVLLGLGFLFYVDGHGLHLSANSIARLIQKTEHLELFRATYFFDEIISHIMLDGGIFLISVGLILSAPKLTFKSLTWKNFILILFGAAFYGFTFTLNCIEGQTVVICFPSAGVGFFLSLLFYLRNRKQGVHNPMLLFFLSGYFLSILFFSCWGISHSGFPQFSELSWI